MKNHKWKSSEIVHWFEKDLKTIKFAYLSGKLSSEEYAFVRATYWQTLAKKYANDTSDFWKEVLVLANAFTSRWNKHSKYK